MSRYYTETIPADLALALKQKGMPEMKIEWNPIHEKYHCFNTYADVFDWFMGKGVCICMTCTRRAFRMALGYGYVVQNIDKFYASESNSRTWEKSAIGAIGKALELI